MEEAMKKKILDFINKLKKPMSIRQISKNLELSPSTVQRYIDILTLGNEISVSDYGSIKLVSPLEKPAKK